MIVADFRLLFICSRVSFHVWTLDKYASKFYSSAVHLFHLLLVELLFFLFFLFHNYKCFNSFKISGAKKMQIESKSNKLA